jgi:AraC family transcriptional activator of pobA
MKGNPVYLHTIKDMNDFAGHSWYPEGLQILLSRTERKKPSFQHPFRSDSYWVILVMNDSLTIQLNEEECVLKANDLLIIPPHAVRQSSGAENSCKVACVAFTPDFLLDTGISQKHIDSFEYLTSNPCTHLQLTLEDASRFMAVITMLQEKNFSEEGHPFAAEVVRHFFNVFQFELAGLYYKYTNQKKVVHDRKEELLWRFLALLPEHVKAERSLQFYANRLYVTPKYLTQTVKKVSGKTAGKYIDDLVIVEAKNLLRNPSLSIGQVAEHLYFSDQFFFSKFFKRYTGVTPSDYRRSA